MTETEKYIKTDSRSVTGNIDTELEPEFKPFNYGTESQTAFEVEKQYTFDSKTYENPEPVRMDFPTLERKSEKQAQEIVAAQIVARPKLNAHGKILVSVVSIIVAIIVAFCIYNAVSISQLESEIAAKNQIVAEQNQDILRLQEEYNSLGEDSSILERLEGLDSNYKTPSASDIKRVGQYQNNRREEQQTPSNWFERLCAKLQSLFS